MGLIALPIDPIDCTRASNASGRVDVVVEIDGDVGTHAGEVAQIRIAELHAISTEIDFVEIAIREPVDAVVGKVDHLILVRDCRQLFVKVVIDYGAQAHSLEPNYAQIGQQAQRRRQDVVDARVDDLELD